MQNVKKVVDNLQSVNYNEFTDSKVRCESEK
nr:MAG TPA: hypothetical protein [Caudoviricetes sp.]